MTKSAVSRGFGSISEEIINGKLRFFVKQYETSRNLLRTSWLVLVSSNAKLVFPNFLHLVFQKIFHRSFQNMFYVPLRNVYTTSN